VRHPVATEGGVHAALQRDRSGWASWTAGCRVETEGVGTEARLAALRRKEAALEDAYVYKRRVDSITYERQRDKLREEIALCEIELEDARIDAIDIEGLLGFAEHLLANASRLWMEATPENRPQIQRVLFTEGLRFRDGTFGTAVSCFAFTQLAAIGDGKSGMASAIWRVVSPRLSAPTISCSLGVSVNTCRVATSYLAPDGPSNAGLDKTGQSKRAQASQFSVQLIY
jgi:hypothetical protein